MHPPTTTHTPGNILPAPLTTTNSCDSDRVISKETNKQKKNSQRQGKFHPQSKWFQRRTDSPQDAALGSWRQLWRPPRKRHKQDICAGDWRGDGCFPSVEIQEISKMCCLATGPLPLQEQNEERGNECQGPSSHLHGQSAGLELRDDRASCGGCLPSWGSSCSHGMLRAICTYSKDLVIDISKLLT